MIHTYSTWAVILSMYMYDLSTSTGIRMFLMHWVIAVGCALHDVHNACKWALACFLEIPKRDLKFIHIATVSLRRSFFALVSTSHIVVEHMQFRDYDFDDDELRAFWTLFGMKPDSVDFLVRTQCKLDEDDILRCSKRVQHEADLHARVHANIKKVLM